jgi:hypothetical protein
VYRSGGDQRCLVHERRDLGGKLLRLVQAAEGVRVVDQREAGVGEGGLEPPRKRQPEDASWTCRYGASVKSYAIAVLLMMFITSVDDPTRKKFPAGEAALYLLV